VNTATKLDPVTFEVVSHRLYSINEEGATTIVHASGSPVVHATDYNFAIYTAAGEIAVTGVFYMLPLFVMQLLIKHVLATVPGEELREGDVFVSNDPFTAGVHQSDVQFVSPFFHEGELVAWTGCMAHVMDLGGMFPGSWCPTATDVFQEGLRVPLSRIVEAGKVNRGIWDMILANSRMPAMVANDFSAFLSAHRVSQARLAEACETYGGEVVAATMATSIERTEAQMREWVAELPDGDFEQVGFVDHDGHQNNLYKVRCLLRKRGDRLVFDFTGTDPAIVGMGNATASGTYGAIATVVVGIFGSRLGWNAGLLRNIEVITEPNSVVSAEPPSPVSAGSVTGTWIANGAAAVCTAKMLAFSEYRDYVCGPADGSWILVQFGGLNQYGEPFGTMVMDSLGWGGSAFDFRDGVDVGGSLICLGGGFNDVEQEESNSPLLWLWRREASDSGGAGRFRGGNGIEFGLAVHGAEEMQVVCGTQGAVVPGLTGMFGAQPGGTSRYEIVQGTDWRERYAAGETIAETAQLAGEHSIPEAKFSMDLVAGDVINNITQNAGGYGDPLERDPERVRADHRDGKVTAEFAAAAYGVVLTEGGEVDESATAARRAAAREARKDSLRNRRDHYEVRDDLEVVHTWADVINLVRDGDDLLVQALPSGTILGPLGDDWRATCPWRPLTTAELGPRITVDPRLELRQYVDPLSGRALLVDLVRAGDEPVVDFRLV